MAGNLIPLEEAAKLLGKSVDELTDLRSRNEIFGYRDGSSWKFKMEEISRFAEENGIDLGSPDVDDLSSDSNLVADAGDDLVLDDGEIDLGGSDIEVGPGSHVLSGGDSAKADGGSGSQIELTSESHVLSGSDLEVGSGESDTGKMTNDDDDDLLLAEDDLFGDADEIGLEEDSSSGDLSLDSDSEMLSDFDDDSSMMLEDDSSEISLDAADSGVNLSPTDSGLSLDEEPLELGGSDIDALELPEDSGINLINPQDSGSSPGLSGLGLEDSGIDIGASGSSSNIDMSDSELGMDIADSSADLQADGDFILTPVEGEVEDESSGSQVIALEDSEIYADDSSDLVSDSSLMDSGFQQPGGALEVAPEAAQPVFEDPGMAVETSLAPSSAAAAQTPAMMVEQPIPGWMVAIQFLCLILLIAAGIITVDLIRNMFEFGSEMTVTARITEWIIDFTGYFKA